MPECKAPPPVHWLLTSGATGTRRLPRFAFDVKILVASAAFPAKPPACYKAHIAWQPIHRGGSRGRWPIYQRPGPGRRAGSGRLCHEPVRRARVLPRGRDASAVLPGARQAVAPPTLVHLDKLRLYRHACPAGTGPTRACTSNTTRPSTTAVPRRRAVARQGHGDRALREARARVRHDRHRACAPPPTTAC